ncbi:MAG: Gldg family protein [Candidatus Aminicenantes bacterium]|nr:Gldg family protein [Candidatus Aminicenantes bacterium]
MDKKKEMTKYYKFLLYLVIIVLVNLVGANLFFHLDLTKNRLYSLSEASREAVSTLKEPMTINVFFTKNLPVPYNTVESYLHDLLEEYAVYAGDTFNYRFFDVSAKEGDLSEKAEENRKKAQDYGIYPVNVQTIEQDEATVQRAYMGMVFLHGDIVERLPAVTSTEGLEYQITTTIRKMNNKISALLNLENKIKVTLIQSSSLDQIAPEVNLEGLDGLRSSIEKSVNELNAKVYGQLEFVFLDPSSESVPQETLNRFSRFGLQWPEHTRRDGVSVAAGNGIVALGMQYGDRTIERRLLNRSLGLTDRGLQEKFELAPVDEIKTFIEENIDNIINIHQEIGYLSSHGSLSLSPALPPQFQGMQQPQEMTLNRFNTLLRNNYSINNVDIKEGIPDKVDTLIIAGPREEFSDWELFQLDQFLMKGKSLAIFLDAFNEISPQRQQYGMQQPVYLPLNTGLEKLLDHYGAQVKKSYVLDENCYVSRDRTSGEMPFYFAPIIKNENINSRYPFMRNINELIMIKVSPVELLEEKIKANKIDTIRLLSSSKKSWEMSGRIDLSPWMLRPPANPEEKKPYDLAYILEGEFPSYFAEKPIPEKPKEEETEQDEESVEETPEEKPEEKPEEQAEVEPQIKAEKTVLTKGEKGKILLVGTSEILKDNLLDEEGNSPNAVFILNTIDYLNNREDIAAMRSKKQRFNPIKDTTPLTRNAIKVFNIAGLPILFILFGFVVWARRRARRKMIQGLFISKSKSEEKSS